jgi:hypothetical protein
MLLDLRRFLGRELPLPERNQLIFRGMIERHVSPFGLWQLKLPLFNTAQIFQPHRRRTQRVLESDGLGRRSPKFCPADESACQSEILHERLKILRPDADALYIAANCSNSREFDLGPFGRIPQRGHAAWQSDGREDHLQNVFAWTSRS